jgi:hypothetical protein
VIREDERGKFHLATWDWVIVIHPKLVTHHVNPLVDRLAYVRRLPDKYQGRHPPPKALKMLEQLCGKPITARTSTKSPETKHRPYR